MTYEHKLHGRYSTCRCNHDENRVSLATHQVVTTHEKDTAWLSIDQVAQVLGVSYSTAQRQTYRGAFKTIKRWGFWSNSWIIPTEELHRVADTKYGKRLIDAIATINTDPELAQFYNSPEQMYRTEKAYWAEKAW